MKAAGVFWSGGEGTWVPGNKLQGKDGVIKKYLSSKTSELVPGKGWENYQEGRTIGVCGGGSGFA